RAERRIYSLFPFPSVLRCHHIGVAGRAAAVMTRTTATELTPRVCVEAHSAAEAHPASSDARATVDDQPGLVRRLLAGAITGYQRLSSPLLGPRCRFTPSGSEYAQEAILVRGPIVGLGLA